MHPIQEQLTRQKIIDKASKLFLELGFKSVTMDDIADELAMSKKTLYMHFENKTKLVDTVTCCVFDSVCSGIEVIQAESLNPIEELYSIKMFVMKHLKNEKTSPHFQLKKYYPKIYANMRMKQFEKMLSSVQESIKRGVEQDLFRAQIDVGFIARMYFNGMTGIKDESIFPREEYAMEYLMDSYLEYHSRAIVTEKGLVLLNKYLKPNLTKK